MQYRLLFVALLTAGSAHAEPSPETLRRANDYFRREIPRAGFPGAVLTVVSGGRVVLSTGIGVSDLDRRTPVGPDTVFNVASMKT